MAIAFNKLTAVIDLAAIVHNYELLNAAGRGVIPVVKADAYGHGLLPVAQVLSQAGARTFAVGTVEEAVALRAGGHAKTIISLLGPVDEAEYQALWKSNILPFIHSFGQLRRVLALAAERAGLAPGENGKMGLATDGLAGERDDTLSIALKFDTGMRRLGFTLADVPEIAALLRGVKNVRLAMLSSHLATADEPQSTDYLVAQAAEFSAIRNALEKEGFPCEANLANSAAILGNPDLHFDAQRAGIALYGANPLAGTPKAVLGRDLRPAMSVKTVILSVHALKAGQSISYGCTYTASKDMTVAVVAAGYADAYSRGLSGKAWMCLNGRRVPVLGRICMQMCAVDVTGLEGVEEGGDIWLLGGDGEGRISPEELAGWWGTITYEVFCLLGLNRREY